MTDSVQSAGPPAETKTSFWQKFATWMMTICGVLGAGIGLLKAVDHFTLPNCDADRATTTVRDIFKGKDIELVTLKHIKAVTDTKQEKTCTAYIESKDESATIDYKVFWDGWSVKVLIQTVRDEKPR